MKNNRTKSNIKTFIWSLISGLLLSSVFFYSFEIRAAEPTKDTSGLEKLKYKVGDAKGNDRRAAQTETLIAVAEKKAVSQAYKLLRKYKGTAMEPDLWLRLAELYMRRSKTDRFFHLNRRSSTVVHIAPKLVKKASPKKMVKRSIGIYDKIIRRFPRFEKMDLVLFNNAFANQQLGKHKKAEKLYWKLISKYRRSPLVPDSHLAIGEMAFKDKKFKHALDHFMSIRKYPQARVYPYGLYKAAWTYYNLGNTKAGLKELEEVIKYGRYIKQQEIDSRLDLRKEALADMTIFYEDVFPASQAFSYFRGQAGELDVSPIILKLSYLYKRHSRHKDRKVLLDDFISQLPNSSYIPTAHVELISTYEKMKQRMAAVKQMQAMHDVCDPKGRWSNKQSDQEKNGVSSLSNTKVVSAKRKKPLSAHESCQLQLNTVALKHANKWLKIWKKNKTLTIFANAAEKTFEIYLIRNTNTEKSNQNRYAYAELLFQRNKYRQASEQYNLVGLKTKKRKLGHDSRYSALLSLEKAVNDKWDNKDEELFQKLGKTYIGKHPKGKYRLDIEYKMALIAYDKGRYDEAAPVFLKLGRIFRTAAKGIKAQDLYLDILNAKKDFEGLKNYSVKLLKYGGKKDRLAKISKIYEESYFSQVQSLEEANDYKDAIKGYQKFAKENPKSALAQKGLWNAVQLFYKISDLQGAASASVDYYNRFPKSKEALNGLMKAAQTYETMGQLESAAKVLLKLAVLDKESKSKWKKLAADFYSLNRNYKKALPIYNELYEKSGLEMKFSSLLHLKDIAKIQNKTKSYEKYLKKIMATGRQPHTSEAKLYFVEQLFAKKNYERAFIDAKGILNMSNGSVYSKSKARFIQAQILDNEFQKQSIKTNVDRVALVLGIKTEKLEKAQLAYQSAIRYGDPYVAIQAMQHLADAYFHYNKALLSMPSPRGMSAEAEASFRNEIGNLAIPMEEKGVETLLQALNEARRMGVRDGSVEQIQARLNRLNLKPTESLFKVNQPELVVPVVRSLTTAGVGL